MNEKPPSISFTTQRNHVSGPFSDASKPDIYDAKLLTNISLLLENLMQYDTRTSANTPEAEADIQNKFRQFLIGCEFYMAIEDFDDLLEESDLKPRDDGTTAWHHQFSQILIFLDKIKRGKITLVQLDQHGGVETCIRTIMRHDSLEDFGHHPTKFKSLQEAKIERTFDKLVSRGLFFSHSHWRTREYQRLEILMNNLNSISKKIVVLGEDGEPILDEATGKYKRENLFPTDIAYIANMLDAPTASPIVFDLKTNDGSHNLGTMLMAPKFDAMKRKDYANKREDIYGGRNAFPERAQHQWPNFAPALKESDDLMGAVLFTNLGYLAMVDQTDAYPNKPKYRDGDEIYPSGLFKYLPGALSYSGPRAFSPLHNLIDDIQLIAHDNSHPVRAKRARLFLQHSIKPALSTYPNTFPRLFNDPLIGEPSRPQPKASM